jgi:hypothetical protein
MMNYANGGLQNTAYYLKGKGRGKDTELVHMSPKEIKGLQAMAKAHGGSLTINPDTGLPEAGFLEDILPIVAAAGLTYLTAGAAAPTLTAALGGSTMAGGIAAGALSGAAISGGMAAIQGKNVGQAALMGGLGGGISGGLGAYDAANVFNAPNLLADASQQVVQVNPADAANIMQEGFKVAPPTPDVSNVYSGLAGQPTVPPGTMPPGLTDVPYAPTQAGTAASQLKGQARIDALNKLDPSANAFGQAPGINAEQAMFRAENLANPSEVGDIYKPITQSAVKTQMPSSDSYYGNLGPDNYIQKAGIQALPVLGLMQDEQQQVGPQDDYQSPLRRISPNFRAYEPPRPNPYYSARYAAEGGVINSSSDDELGGDYSAMGMDQGNMQKGLFGLGYASGGVTKLPKGDPGIYRDADPTTRGQDAFTAALTRLNAMQKRANIKGLPALKAAAPPLSNIQEAAKGGVMSSLGGYSDGGRMLKGPGDGMSDSIPGVIGRRQPARLADGEFVVPADVVSHLGNGSTDAGAKKLYAMMDKIRKARTGKKKQAPAVKADRYMPA